MQKKTVRILAAVLVLALAVGLTPNLNLQIKASAAGATEAIYDFVSDISLYRANTKLHDANNNNAMDMQVYDDYPTKEGHVFAGWYTDIVNRTPLGKEVVSGGAYAKFVPEKMMKAVAQVSTATDYTTALSALRFVAAVDSMDYAQVGFLLNKEGSAKTYTHGTTTVHTALSAAISGGKLTPAYFHSCATHMYALTVTGIKDQTANYTATPFWITQDGTRVDHLTTSNKAVEMGINANVAAGRTQIAEETAWYKNSDDVFYISNAQQLYSFAQLSKTNNFAGQTIILTDDITYNGATIEKRNWFVHDVQKNEWSVKEGVELWPGIGSADVPFAGTFDGQGHKVEGLVMLDTGKLGFFVQTNGATIKNLRVENSTFRNLAGSDASAHCTGALVAYAKDTSVSYTYSDAYLAYGNAVGLLGHVQGTTNVNNCWFDGTLNGAWGSIRAGGIIGFGNSASTTINLTNCLFTGSADATFNTNAYVGGLVGFGNWGNKINITNCLSAGNMNKAAYKGTTNGSIIGNTPSGGGGNYVNVYATNGCYQNAEGTPVTVGSGTNFKGAITLVDGASIQGHGAKTALPELDFAGYTWNCVSGGVPELGALGARINTGWYDPDATEYVINTAAELNGLAYLSQTHTFANKTVKLGADIVYNTGNAADWATTAPANVWTPIAQTNGEGFLGTFDGQGHTVSGLYYSGEGYAALIGRMYAGSQLKNLRLVNTYFNSIVGADAFHHSAGVVGRLTNGATISGVYTDAILKAQKSVGMVGFNDGGTANIFNCWFDGTIDITGAANAGGMIGAVANSQTHNIKNCLFTGTMTGTAGGSAYIGGIYGLAPWSVVMNVTNCLSAGDMTDITSGIAGSVAGNNPGGNKSVYTGVYAVSGVHPNLKGAGGATFPVTEVAKTDIIGTAATTVLTQFDFEGLWSVRQDDVPALGKENMDITWYDENAAEYVLYDAADLNGFAYLTNTLTFEGKTVKLGADITLNEGNAKDWERNAPANVWDPIGVVDADTEKTFLGTFDGQGHTISGLYYSSNSYGGGMFALIDILTEIKNFRLVNSYVASTYGATWSATGGLAAFANGGAVRNVYTDVIVETNSGYTGGFIGRVQGNGIAMDDCEFAGSVTTTGSAGRYVGGLVGGHNGNIVVSAFYGNCTVSGTVTGAADNVGGLSGLSNGNASCGTVSVSNFTLTGSVSGASTFVGGVFGECDAVPVTIIGADIRGSVSATAGICGGVVGRAHNARVTIQNSTVTGTISGGTKIGGFVGQTNYAGFTTTVQDSLFSGTVTGTNTTESVVAGVVAHVNNGNVQILNCVSEGTMIAAGAYAAGAIALITNTSGINISVEGVVSTADIQCNTSNAGGIIGRILGTNVKATMKNNLAAATFNADTWCTSQIIAHAQNNVVEMENNFFVQTPYSASSGIESSGGSVTNKPVKISQEAFGYLKQCWAVGLYPDYNGFVKSGYQIQDLQDLYGFYVCCEATNLAGKTVTLKKDVIINEGKAADWATTAPKYPWMPIGGATGEYSFAGTFDGEGHTISGLYCAYPGGNSMGMFGEVTGTLNNFRLVNSCLANTEETQQGYNGGVVACLNGGTVSRVYTDAIVMTVDNNAGGIVGKMAGNTATVTQCQFDGVLIARCSMSQGCVNPNSNYQEHARYVGGIVGGLSAATNNISDCISSGSIYNEDRGTHRTGGIAGGAPAVTTVTIDHCMSLVKMHTLGHTANSYHFNMIMDCRGVNNVTTKPTNVNTMFTDNYVLSTYTYQANGVTKINSGTYTTGATNAGPSTIRYTEEEMANKITTDYLAGKSNLDFVSVWRYNPDGLPTLRMGDTTRTAVPYQLTIDGEQVLCVALSGVELDTFKDANLKEALLEGQTTSSGHQLYSLTYEYPAAVTFKDIDYTDGAYITKYKNAKLADYQWYIEELKGFGFQVVASNIVNTDDAYYTALTYGGHSYSVTFFANTGELYVTASKVMKFSPYMDANYYKTADKNDPKKTTYNDITVTCVQLSNGGLCQVIRLKNGHYIVIDGGTKVSYTILDDGTMDSTPYQDRRELAAALGASTDAYSAGDKNNPQIIVDAWIFTHDHADHVGWLQGGVYGALQVDVYVKGFYYNFSDHFRVDTDVKVSTASDGSAVYTPGYANQFYAYEDSKGVNNANRYTKAELDTANFWVEWTASHKMANNVNVPSWGTKGIPIYRLQAGQKYYFDGVTMEVPYTQDQVQPSEYRMDINASCPWLLFTDNHGNTYLEAGDSEVQNQDAVIKLYDDYYDGGSGPNYELFGADLVNAFHHGLNMEVVEQGDYTRQNIIFGVQNADGNPKTANTATNANDGRTKYIFYTRGYLNSLFGYVSDKTSWNSRMMQGNHYLTGYVYPGLITSSLNNAKAYPNLKTPIAFGSNCAKMDEKGYKWQGTITVSFASSGISWDKQQTTSIYP